MPVLDTTGATEVRYKGLSADSLYLGSTLVWKKATKRTFQQEYVADASIGVYIDTADHLIRPIAPDGSAYVCIVGLGGDLWCIDVWIAVNGAWVRCVHPTILPGHASGSGTSGETFGPFSGLNDPTANAYCYGFHYPSSEDGNFTEDPSNYTIGNFRIDEGGMLQMANPSNAVPIVLPAGMTWSKVIQFWQTDDLHYGNEGA